MIQQQLRQVKLLSVVLSGDFVPVGAAVVPGWRGLLAGCFSSGAAVPVSRALPAVWLQFVLPDDFICPLTAQLALARGEVETYAAGRLVIGGRVLCGRSGGEFNFSSAVAAARWCDMNRDRLALELSVLDRLDLVEAAEWRAERVLALEDYASRIVESVAKQGDAALRAAMLAEVDFSLVKWIV